MSKRKSSSVYLLLLANGSKVHVSNGRTIDYVVNYYDLMIAKHDRYSSVKVMDRDSANRSTLKVEDLKSIMCALWKQWRGKGGAAGAAAPLI